MKPDDELLNLSPEDQDALIKKRSKKRLFNVLIFINIGLLVYLIYSFIMLFTHLG